MVCPGVVIVLFLLCLVTSYIRAGHLNVRVNPKYKTFLGAEAGIGKKSKHHSGRVWLETERNDSWVPPAEHCPDLKRQKLRSHLSPPPERFSKVIWKMIVGGKVNHRKKVLRGACG